MTSNGNYIMQAPIKNAFHYTDKFGASDGFALAAGLTDYPPSGYPIIEARYGSLVIESQSWNRTTDVDARKTESIIDDHKCSDQEIGLSEAFNATDTFINTLSDF